MVLSIFNTGYNKDYSFIDNQIKSLFNISGVIVHAYKYLGPVSQHNEGDSTITSGPTNVLSIEDILFSENRDRQYDKNIIDLKCHYTVTEVDFLLSQFGILLGGGKTLILTFHMNDVIDRLGRKLVPGDVLEIINKREDVVLDTDIPFISAYYVVQDVARAADGYSPTWYPHILRCRCEQIVDSVEFKPILDQLKKRNLTIRDMISTQARVTEFNQIIQEQAEKEVPFRYTHDTSLYTNVEGDTIIQDNAVGMLPIGYLSQGKTPPNQDKPAPEGRSFPTEPESGDYFIRCDYRPERLYRRSADNTQWLYIWDIYQTKFKAGIQPLDEFLNDDETTVISPTQTFDTRRAITDPLPPPVITEDKEIDKDLGIE